MRGAFVGLLWLMGIVSIANGAWMVGHAWSWFTILPGVADTGAVNGHFIHDVVVVYALCGDAFIWCERNIAVARQVYVFVTLFFVLHALGHVGEILLGQLPPRHWWVDLPLIFAPAVLLGAIALPGPWRRVTAA